MCATIVDTGIRRLRPDDLGAYLRFAHRLEPEDVRLRFGRLIRWTDDCVRGILDKGDAFAAFDRLGEIAGVARLIEGEIALIVRSDLKRHGIGRALLDRLVAHAVEHGMSELSGYFLAENRPAIALAHGVGFRLKGSFGSAIELRLCLP
jgi:acetyltransferase